MTKSLSEMSLEALLPAVSIARINHIGSTAVPKLLAKPTVDILLEIATESEVEMIESKLKKVGWIVMSSEKKDKLNIVFNKGYTPQGFADKVFHLHLRYLDDWDELYFRDYLIAHLEIAEKYGELKRGLEKEYKHDRDGYTEAKSEFIKNWTAEARKELKEKYFPQEK